MRRPEPGARLGAGAALLVAGLVSLLVGLLSALPAGAAGEGPGDGPVASTSTTSTTTPDPSSTETASPVPSETASPTPTPTPTPGPTSPTTAPSTTSTTTPTPGTGPTEVVGAVLRWGISDQTNARSHNPGAINFLAAGVANPGRGGVHLKEAQWRAREGNVTIEKRTATGWQRATWKGLSTAADSTTPIGTYGPFSGHTAVLRKATGTVDRAAGTARVTWKGTFTVVYYGGNTAFTVTDPTLDVAGGQGTVTATLGGFLADRNDPRKWDEAAPKRVRIAVLPDVDLGERGFTAQPAYGGVTVTGSEPQDRTSAGWGAFPQDFVTYLGPFGIDQFWYSTGLQADSTKKPLPLTVSWTAKEVAAPAPEETTAPAPKITNTAPAPPVAAAPVAPLPADPVAAPAQPPGAAAVTAPAAAQPAATWQLTAAPAAGPAPAAAAASGTGWYVGGGLLLVAAAASLLLSNPPRRAAPARSR